MLVKVHGPTINSMQYLCTTDILVQTDTIPHRIASARDDTRNGMVFFEQTKNRGEKKIPAREYVLISSNGPNVQCPCQYTDGFDESKGCVSQNRRKI